MRRFDKNQVIKSNQENPQTLLATGSAGTIPTKLSQLSNLFSMAPSRRRYLGYLQQFCLLLNSSLCKCYRWRRTGDNNWDNDQFAIFDLSPLILLSNVQFFPSLLHCSKISSLHFALFYKCLKTGVLRFHDGDFKL